MAIFPSAVAADSDLYIAVNNKVTNLTAGISNSDLTIPVASTTGFPSVGYISIDNEIIHYTSVGASQFNADLRGADGTTAASHLNTTQINHNVIASHHNVLKEEIKAIEQNLNDRLGLSATIITLQADMAANAKKITGLAAGTVNGDALRYEQLIGSYLPLSGGTLTGALLAANGSAAVPTVSFVGDGTTGIYLVSAGNIGISNNGVQTWQITTSGALIPVGAGTKSIGNTSNYASGIYLASGTASLPSYTFGADNDTGMYSRIANTLDFATNGALWLEINSTGQATFTGQLIGKGTATNDSPSAGYIGEYSESVVSTLTNYPATGTFGDLASLTLSAGDWDVQIVANCYNNGATWTHCYYGVSTTSGNSATGLVYGDSEGVFNFASSATAIVQVTSSLIKRFSLSGSTTIYLKYAATYSAGTPQSRGRISARRVR